MRDYLREFNSVMGRINGAYHDFSVYYGLSDSAMSVLYTLSLEDGCSQSDICRISGMSKTTINAAVLKMEKDGLLHLESGHGRNRRIILSDKGKELAERTAKVLYGTEEKIFAAWTQEERDVFKRLHEDYLNRFIKCFAALKEEENEDSVI